MDGTSSPFFSRKGEAIYQLTPKFLIETIVFKNIFLILTCMPKKVYVVFPDKLLSVVDRIVKELGFHKSRSDFILEAVRQKVRSEYAIKEEGALIRKEE